MWVFHFYLFGWREHAYFENHFVKLLQRERIGIWVLRCRVYGGVDDCFYERVSGIRVAYAASKLFFAFFQAVYGDENSAVFKELFRGVLWALTVFPVSRYSFTAFRASCIRNFPSSKLSSNDKPVSSIAHLLANA